jgi:hypothetical protein
MNTSETRDRTTMSRQVEVVARERQTLGDHRTVWDVVKITHHGDGSRRQDYYTVCPSKEEAEITAAAIAEQDALAHG